MGRDQKGQSRAEIDGFLKIRKAVTDITDIDRIGIPCTVNRGMTATEIAAWWGAVVATLVFLWDIYKWKTRGPKISMRLSPHMIVMGDPRREGRTWVTVTVTNIGDQPTTIKSLGFEYYTSCWKRIRKRTEKAFVVTNPSDRYPLPLVLNPGDEWVGFTPQDRDDIDLETMSRNGHLLASLSQSHTDKPLRKRLIIKNSKDDS